MRRCRSRVKALLQQPLSDLLGDVLLLWFAPHKGRLVTIALHDEIDSLVDGVVLYALVMDVSLHLEGWY